MLRRITIKDISKKVGVSTTTVTKALNGKAKVSEEMRNFIIETAQELGYKPNKSARALARKDINIGIIVPEEPVEFLSYLKNGLEKGINDLLDFNVRGIFSPVKDLHSAEETKKALNDLLLKNVDGIIICPVFEYKEYAELAGFILKKGIPFVYLVNDIPGVEGIGCVRLNGNVAGKMAAQFLSLCVPEEKSIVVLTSNKEVLIHKECINGFIEESNQKCLRLKGIYETQDDKQIAYYLTEKVIKEIPNIGGIYVSSYNSVAVCKCLEDYGKENEIVVIGQDLYPELVEKLEKGSLKATLYQDPYEQGRSSVKKLYTYLTENKRNVEDLLVTPQLIMTSNLECYRNKYR